MAKKKAFYQQDYASHIGAVAMCLTSFISVALLACGTPLGMLMVQSWETYAAAQPGTYFDRPCFTLWGMRNNCWNANYSMRVDDEQIAQCPDMRTRFEAAEAFSIIALFFLLILFGASWYKICGTNIKNIVTMLAVFTLGSTTVPFAVVTSFYYTPYCSLDFLTHRYTRFGAGYALTVASFGLQAIGLILFLFLEPELAPSTRKLSSEEPSEKAATDATSEQSSH